MNLNHSDTHQPDQFTSLDCFCQVECHHPESLITDLLEHNRYKFKATTSNTQAKQRITIAEIRRTEARKSV